MQVFDLPAKASEISQIVIVEYADLDRSEKTRRELWVFDVVSQLAKAANGNSEVGEKQLGSVDQ